MANCSQVLLVALALTACSSDSAVKADADRRAVPDSPYAIVPERLFDGFAMREGYGVVVGDAKITAVGPVATLPAVRRVVLPGATLLPGFIDLHAHVAFQQVPFHTVLRHGVTTVRDLGGPLKLPAGGSGSLRYLSAGPIITAPHGYPMPVFGGSAGHGDSADTLAVEVSNPVEARAVVNRLVDAGASVIKIALEPGGSTGAPWSMHGGSRPPPWPILSVETTQSIVQQAHARGRKVSAHLSNATGVQIALDVGVDEWAHMPCETLPESLIVRAVQAGVEIVGTLDTLSHCAGIFRNTEQFANRGGKLLYGTDMAHAELPWGIDAQELELMMHASHGKLSLEAVLASATAMAGEHLGLAPLGQIVPGAPADLIAVRGNPMHRLKSLEYPELVISGGKIIVDDLLRTK